MAGKGFAFPRQFGRDPKDLPSALSRNNRELVAFLNAFVVRTDDDGNVTIEGDLHVTGDITADGTITP